MGMGRRKRETQHELWLATDSLPEIPQNYFTTTSTNCSPKPASTISSKNFANRITPANVAVPRFRRVSIFA